MSDASVVINEKAAEALYRQGQDAEGQGQDEKAIEAYEGCLNENPDYDQAMFRLALLYDRRADDAKAIELYERLCTSQPVSVNALMNLAILYEDNNHYHEAHRCLETVLRSNPNHARARLYMKDVESARSMYYDDDSLGDHKGLPMEISINEFELSVRSRNCLKKMNIRTLGDLLKTTEQELLSYKNFGETSLNEIKTLLGAKGLRLGQSLEVGEMPIGRRAPAPLPDNISQEILAKSVAELELSVRSRKALQRLNINTLGDLAQRTEEELLACKNFGQTSLVELKAQLEQNGLGFRKLDQ
jgi:DNA-directed RNA polymerase subunit alpha